MAAENRVALIPHGFSARMLYFTTGLKTMDPADCWRTLGGVFHSRKCRSFKTDAETGWNYRNIEKIRMETLEIHVRRQLLWKARANADLEHRSRSLRVWALFSFTMCGECGSVLRRTNRKMTRQCAPLRQVVMVNKVVFFFFFEKSDRQRTHMAETDKGFFSRLGNRWDNYRS